MWESIRRLVSSGSTILLTTQYLDEADQLADRIAVIDHGRVVAECTPRELKAAVGKATLRLQLADEKEALNTFPGPGMTRFNAAVARPQWLSGGIV